MGLFAMALGWSTMHFISSGLSVYLVARRVGTA
jgi:hypothetical protein